MSVDAQRENFACGLITHDEFEKAIEPALLREAGPGAAVPDGWEPLPPCDHDWVDITRLGDASESLLCARCGKNS